MFDEVVMVRDDVGSGRACSRPLNMAELDHVLVRITARWKRPSAIRQVARFMDLLTAFLEETRKQGTDGRDIPSVIHEVTSDFLRRT